MQYVSPEYRESMKQSLRDRGYIRVVFGGKVTPAQDTAVITGNQLSYSDTSRIFNNGNDSNVYAALEENFIKADGSLLFRTTEPENYLEKAFISDNVVTSDYQFTVSFDTPVSFGVLIFNFGNNYPTAFTITDNNENTYQYTNADRICEIMQEFEEVTELLITVTAMKNQNDRLRIYSINFSLALEYRNDMVLDSNLESSISPICENLPQMTFDVRLVNEDHYFDTDNPKSILRQFDTNTEVNVYYGYQLPDHIEWLQAAKLFVEKWDSDKDSAVIYARDILQTLDKDYTGADYSQITLYNLAVAIFTEMGISDYYIDNSLKGITTINALTDVTCKQALQIIANAACKKIFIGRDGSVRIGEEIIGYSFSSNGSLYPITLENDPKITYASLENDFTKADGQMLIAPTSNYLNTGYVSAGISNEAKMFGSQTGDVLLSERTLYNNILNLPYVLTDGQSGTGNPVIMITFTDVAGLRGIRIVFDETYPTRFVVRCLVGSEVTESIAVSNNQQEVTVKFNKGQADQVQIEFVETAEIYNRVHVHHIEVQQGYEFFFDDINIMSRPKFERFETIQRIEVLYYTYTQVEDEWKTTKTVVYEDIEEKGTIINWKNPLVTSQTMAENLLAWLKEYYLSAGTYEFDTRGDPEIDANDKAVQKKYNGEDMDVLITDVSLGFNGAFSGSVKTLKKGGAE